MAVATLKQEASSKLVETRSMIEERLRKLKEQEMKEERELEALK